MASLVWCRSNYKIGNNVKVCFDWDKTYSFIWQGFGLIQPGFVKNVEGQVSIESKNTSTTFGIKDNTPSLALNKYSSGISIIVEKNVPINKFAIGLGMDERGIFIEQAYPKETYQFKTESYYWLACSDNISTQMVLSQSNKDPKIKIDFSTTSHHQNFEFNGKQFIRKEGK